MDGELDKTGLSAESVAMFSVSALLLIFLIPCLYYSRSVIYVVYYKVIVTPYDSEVEQHSTFVHFNDVDNELTRY